MDIRGFSIGPRPRASSDRQMGRGGRDKTLADMQTTASLIASVNGAAAIVAADSPP